LLEAPKLFEVDGAEMDNILIRVLEEVWLHRSAGPKGYRMLDGLLVFHGHVLTAPVADHLE
jgi:hypothetical protein